MNKVITINLNGNAFQLEEAGYEVLRAYLERATTQLHDNPDKGEILCDLEQAIAEKCGSYLRPHKNVVTSGEVEQIVKDMGPVDDGHEPNSADAAGSAAAVDAAAPSGPAVKRLYQIREGAMISGICNGLAAYFNVDVSFVRIGAVALAFLSGGIVALVYLLMMFVIPVANTTEQRAAAHGAPFNTQELIDRAKKQYSEFKDKQEWKQHWNRQRQQ
jgi:phage shock protein PspC (stress-responsive transcriptional regulator)